MSQPAVLRVAINAPLSRLFDYLPLRDHPVQPGCRVRVPFGRQVQIGLVMALADKSSVARNKLRSIDEVIDDVPLLGEDDLWLIGFTSSYYHHPIGEVVAAALPGMIRSGRPVDSPVQMLRATGKADDDSLAQLQKRAPRQAELLALLRNAKDVSFVELDETLPAWRRLRNPLIEKGLLEEFEVDAVIEPEKFAPRSPPETDIRLNSDQQKALANIQDGKGFRAHLLDGVTGSGKTEVYLRLIDKQLASGRQTLVLVPEIGLTPQLVDRFHARLGHMPASFHSGLTESQRLATWRSTRDGSAKLIVGTRSAVFLPLQKAGLIIVDEEHDSSLKQQEGLRYSARDLAIARAKNLGVPVVLGSATPSLETLYRCNEGAYQKEILPSRAGRAVPPLLRLVDLNRHPSDEGLSEPVIKAIERNLADDGQTLVFLNRRGFAPTLICAGCGKIAECRRCDARMTVHGSSERLMCHHCGAVRTIDHECQDCGAPCKPLGQGTERLEDALRARFSAQSIARIDSDSMRLKGTMSRALAQATSGETRILVGTQMLSKGHHFPQLTLVVVINADQGLFSTDFRGSERLAQSLTQVSGRAGRESRQGEVIVQTAFPQHPFWNELFNGGYEKVAESALEERRTVAWPPFSRLALVRASASNRTGARHFLDNARALAEKANIAGVRILGPVSAPMERKAGRYRAQLLLQCPQRKPLHDLLQFLRAALEADTASRKVRWSIDVDPIELF